MPRKKLPLSESIYTEAEILSEAARIRRSRQKVAPRQKILNPCPKCGKPFGVRELRLHKPRCTARAPHT